MSETAALTSFVKWGVYKSNDATKPDILRIKVADPEPFATEYSTNVRVKLYDGQQWNEVLLPIKSHASANAKLLTLWTDGVKKGKIKLDTELTIKTWLGTTNVTKRPIRRFAIQYG